MTGARELTTFLYGADRLPNTINGNPRYELSTEAGWITISSDAACAYEVTNFTNPIDLDDPPLVTLDLTPAGRFFGIRYAHPALVK